MSSEKSVIALDASQLEAPLISAPQRRRLQLCYEQARKLMAQPKYDFDDAHAALTDCVVSDPGNLVYVGAFLDNLSRKYSHNLKGASLQWFLPRGPLKKALAAKQWQEAIKAGAAILKTNPWDAATLRGMATACEHLQCSETELRYLQNASDGNPKDVDVWRHCAHSLARIGEYDQAIACWTRVAELKPNDAEAQQMIGNLQGAKTKWKFGLLKQGETDQSESSIEQDQRALTPIQRWERAVHQDPTSIDAFLQLSSAYGDEGNLSEAEWALQRGLSATGNDLRIVDRLEEVQILKAKQQLDIARRRAESEPSNTATELVKQFQDNLNRLELDIFGKRAERYPQESQWKYEVALRLKRAGNYSEALKRLAEIGPQSEHYPAALLESGECLQHLKQYPRALQAYRQAIDLAAAAGQTDLLKLALYRGGILGTAMQDPSGREFLARLVELDASYRDASSRLHAISHNPV